MRPAFLIVCASLLLMTAGVPFNRPVKAASGPRSQPNSEWAQGQHYVVLLSLEGFRWDYAKKTETKNLLALGRSGASAPEGMLPSYPAYSWPNEYTMVTGLYPGHHGIVADEFLDPERSARFDAKDPKITAEGSWYGGEPLWSVAEHQGMRTACIGWAGCRAEIGGFRPSHLGRADENPASAVRQIVAWLRLPVAERPHLIVAQLAEVGESAQRFGPDAPETLTAVKRMDAEVGRLKAEFDGLHLPIDLVVVSDRGLAKPEGGWITLDQLGSLAGFETAGTLLYGKSDMDRERVYNQLKKATSEFVVYRLKNLPAELRYRSERTGDPVIVATGAYAIRPHGAAAAADSPPRSVDGLDAQRVPEMKVIFFAAGPDIVEGRTVSPFENVNLYPWLAHLLGLSPPKTDGSLNILSGTLRDNGDTGK